MRWSDSWTEWVVVAVVIGTLLLSGPAGGIDFGAERPSLDEGTATVQVVSPGGEPISITDGRFGTGVAYVRMPDLVVNVSDLEGTPRLSYTVTIPELDIEKRTDRLVGSPGRISVPLSDRAIPDSEVADTEARIEVLLQSYSGQTTVVNRTVEVRHER